MLPPPMVLPGAAYNGAAYDGSANDVTAFDCTFQDSTPCTPPASVAIAPPQPTIHHEDKLIKRGTFLRGQKNKWQVCHYVLFPFLAFTIEQTTLTSASSPVPFQLAT